MLGTHPLRAAPVLLPLVAAALAVAVPGAASVVSTARASVDDDIQTVTERRFATIVGATTGASSISAWFVDACMFGVDSISQMLLLLF